MLSNNISPFLPLCCNYYAYCMYKIQVYISSPMLYQCLYTVCANIYIETVYLIHIHTHYFYSLHNSVHIGLILITLIMYLTLGIYKYRIRTQYWQILDIQ